MSGLAALSLDALSSVAYRPEAIVIVLMAAGTAGLDYTLPVTLAIVILLGVLVISYRQAIAAFPGGGGFVLDRAIRKGTENVVICRLRFQRSTWSAPDS